MHQKFTTIFPLLIVSLCLPLLAQPGFAALRVTSVSPESHEKSAPIFTPIRVFCDDVPAENSVHERSFVVFGQKSGLIRGVYQVDEVERSLTFTPDDYLIPGDHITVVLTDEIAGTGGGFLENGYVWNFDVQAVRGNRDFQLSDIDLDMVLTATASADFDNDGVTDLVVAGERNNLFYLQLLYYRGDAFVKGASLVIPYRAFPIYTGDYNADGQTDILLIYRENSAFSICYLRSNGSLQQGTVYDLGDNTIEPRAGFVSDVNADGFLDAVLLNRLIVPETAFRFTTPVMPPAVVGLQYDFTLELENGEPPYTYSIVKGTLPVGLGFNGQKGTISGTPVQTGMSFFTIRATDRADPVRTVYRDFFIDVVARPVVNEEFVGDSLSGFIVYIPEKGPEFSLTDNPGSVRLTIPKRKRYDHWINIDDAPQLRRSLNDAEWKTETRMTLNAASSEEFLVGLIIYISRYNLYYWGFNGASDRLRLAKRGPGRLIDVDYDGGDTVDLRIRRVGNNYIFEYRKPDEAQWTSVYTDAVSQEPTQVGLMGKTWGFLDLEVDFDYFRLYEGDELMIVDETLPSGRIGQHYSTTLLGEGGTPPYSWSVVQGHMPDGLELNGASGEISGTPLKDGLFAFRVGLLDDSPTLPAAHAKLVTMEIGTVERKPIMVCLNDGSGNPGVDADHRHFFWSTVRGETVFGRDLNLDGWIDVGATKSGHSGGFFIFNNPGETPSFADSADYRNLVFKDYERVVTASFTEDDLPDVAAADRNSDIVDLYTHRGVSGGIPSFAAPSSFPASQTPRWMEYGDIDADGHLDLVTIGKNQPILSILFNDGTGDFHERSQLGISSEPQSFAVGDFDGDYALDLFVVDGSGRASFIRNAVEENVAPEAPQLTGPENGVLINAAHLTPTWSVPGDDNGDPLHFVATFENVTGSASEPVVYDSRTTPEYFTPTPPVPQGMASVSLTLPEPLPDGGYNWTVGAWDGLVFGPDAAKRSFTMDNTAPSEMSLVFPNAIYGGHWFKATDGSDTPVTVELYYTEQNADSAILETDEFNGPFVKVGIPSGVNQRVTYFLIQTGIGDGKYDLVGRIVDEALNTGTVADWIGIDGTPPTGTVARGPSVSQTETFTIRWDGGTDGEGSGLAGLYNVRLRIDSGIWLPWLNRVTSIDTTFRGEHGHRYSFEAAAYDNVGNFENFTGVAEIEVLVDTTSQDLTPPDRPRKLTAGGSDPSPWQSDPEFTLRWEPPYDVSGILASFWKVGAAPKSNDDYDGTGGPAGPVQATAGQEGGTPVFVWLSDSAGNVDYRNYASVQLRWDGTPPVIHSAQLRNPAPVYSADGRDWYNSRNTDSFTAAVRYTELYTRSATLFAAGLVDTLRRVDVPDGAEVETSFLVQNIRNKEGTYTLEAALTDSALNRSVSQVQLGLDATPPLGSVAGAVDTARADTFTVRWTAGSDGGGSGVAAYNVYVRDNGGAWSTWRAKTTARSALYIGQHGHTYTFEAASIDHVGLEEVRSGGEVSVLVDTVALDTEAPAAPMNLSAGGGTPYSPWQDNPFFEIDWQNPDDQSGIYRSYYSLGDRPVSNYDTTGSGPAEGPFIVENRLAEQIWLFLWLEDNAGNIDFRNATGVLLRYDSRAPVLVSAQFQDPAPVFEDAQNRYWYDQGETALVTVRTVYTESQADSLILRQSDGTLIEADADPPSGTTVVKNFNLPIGTRADGAYDYRVEVVDIVGQRDSQNLRLGLDNTPPQNTVAAGPDTSTSLTFDVSWSAGTDDGSGLSGHYRIYVQESGKPWQVWLNDTQLLKSPYSGKQGEVYGFEAVTWDRVGNTEARRQVAETVVHVDTLASTDLQPPPPPQNLQADGKSPGPWKPGPTYIVTWRSPYDVSGIRRSLYRVGTAPTGSNDTTGTGSADGPLTINATAEDGQSVFVWLEDGRGNADFRNFASVLLRWDETAPVIDSLSLSDAVFEKRWFNPKVTGTTTLDVYFSEKHPRSLVLQADPVLTFDGIVEPPGKSGQTGFEIDFSEAPDTTLSLKVTLADSAGNSVSDSTDISFDSTPPSGTVASSPDTAAPGDFLVSWTGTPTDGNGSGISGIYDVKVRVDDGPWELWKTRFAGTHDEYTGETDKRYAFEAAAYDNMGLREEFLGVSESVTFISEGFVDRIAPGSPAQVTANGSNPSPWFDETVCVLDWSNPVDPSGIARLRYKFALPPDSPSDTSGSAPGSPPVSVTVPGEEPVDLYLWLVDGSGNSDHNTAVRILLRHDSRPPSIDSGYVVDAEYGGKWMNPRNVSQADIRVIYDEAWPDSAILSIGGEKVFITELESGDDRHVDFTLSLTGRDEGCHELLAVVIDSAGNRASDTLELCLDKTAPTGATASSPETSLTEEFYISWGGDGAGDDGEGSGLSGRYNLRLRVDNGPWYAYLTNEARTSVSYVGVHGHYYSFEVGAIDNLGNEEAFSEEAESTTLVDTSTVDTEPPTAPLNLASDGKNPTPWQSGSTFVLTWDNPADPSGIARAFYKLGGVPESENDTTGSVATSNAAGYLSVDATEENGQMLTLWLADGRGNSDYLNHSRILLRYDATRPRITGLIAVDPACPVNWFNQKTDNSISIRIYFTELLPSQAVVSNDILSDMSHRIGSARDSVDVPVPVINLADGSYWFAVTMTDSAGNASNRDSILINLDSTPPRLHHTPDTQLAAQGDSLRIELQAGDDNRLASVSLLYKRGGERRKNLIDMAWQGDSTYAGIIPAAAVTERGVEYSLQASDGINVTQLPLKRNFSRRVRIAGTDDSGLAYPGSYVPGTKVSAYRMLSVPLELENPAPPAVFGDDLGEYNRQKWRLFNWNSADGIFDEYPQTGDVVPGRALWFISSMKDIFIDTGPGSTVDTADPFVVILEKGWNDLGNPYHFDIAWRDIFVASATDTQKVIGPYAYDGQWVFPTEVSLMHPWEGYSLYTEYEDISLIFPAAEADEGVKKGGSEGPLRRMVWTCALRVRQGKASDTANFFGVSEKATAGWDYGYDFVEPHGIGPFVSLYFKGEFKPLEATEFTSDIRAPGDGHIWDFEVTGDIDGGEVKLTFEEIGEVPASMNFTLVDLETDVSADLKAEPGYSFWFSVANPVRRFRIYAGNADFMEKHREEIPSVVDSYRLVQNYPNPFNGATVISYALEEECDLTLAIYNLLGQRVRLLKQGRFHRGFFQVRWDATDDGGRDVGAGIYLLRMETAAFSATRKMIYLR